MRNISHLDEDMRIDCLCAAAKSKPGAVMVFTIENKLAVIDRYIRKIRELSPHIQILDKYKRAIDDGTISVKITYLPPHEARNGAHLNNRIKGEL